MKKLLYLPILAFGFICHSQDNGFNYAAELAKNVKVPNSPEASAFENYGDFSANLNLGKPNISIPLYTFKGNEMDLPISLTYDIDARKVEDIPTGIGMGWNLNLGGVVTRIAQGLPDDCISTTGGTGSTYQSLTYPATNLTAFRNKYIAYKDKLNSSSETFSDVAEAEDFLNFLNYAQAGCYDLQLDHYSLNAPGLNDRVIFVFDENSNTVIPIMENNPRIEISFAGSLWYVTNDDGTVYEFTEVEKTVSSNADDITDIFGTARPPYIMQYYSSWYLTKITSPNGKDVYEFEYVSFNPWTTEISTTTSKMIDTEPSGWPLPPWSGTEVDIQNKYTISQKALSKVKHNGQEIVELDLKPREDYANDNRIASIEVKSPLNGSTVNFFKLHNDSYFGSGSNERDKRLKLDKIEITGRGYTGASYAFKKEYSFEYEGDPTTMPPRNSRAQDEYGFYNGQSNTQPLYPAMVINGHSLSGGNRNFNFTAAKMGILTRIDYPTGGYTEFEYGTHLDPGETPNGIRIEAIVSNTDENTPVIRKEFDYQDQERYINPHGKPILYYSTYENLTVGEPQVPKHHRLAKAILGDAPYISYRKVIEKLVSPSTQNGNFGETEYLFYDNFGGTTNTVLSNPLNPPNYYMNIKKGIEEKQTVKDASGTILSSSLNEFNPFVLSPNYETFGIQDNPQNGVYYVKAITNNGVTNLQFSYSCATGCFPRSFARLMPYKPIISTQRLEESTQTTTQKLDGNDVTTTSTATYEDGPLNYLLREATNTTSENNVKTLTRYTYPIDLYNQGNTAINDLVNANRLSSPIEVKVYEESGGNETLLSTQITDYGSFGNFIFPQGIKTARRGDTPENRILFGNYDTDGNLTQAQKAAGIPTSYIWGYEGRFPVAKIENLTYTQAIGTTGFNLSTIQNPAVSEAAVQAEINKIRQAWPTAMVTTYTYTPFMEVKTITDPRGKTTTFHYDDENRLEYVTDQDNKVIGKNEYHYRTNN